MIFKKNGWRDEAWGYWESGGYLMFAENIESRAPRALFRLLSEASGPVF